MGSNPTTPTISESGPAWSGRVLGVDEIAGSSPAFPTMRGSPVVRRWFHTPETEVRFLPPRFMPMFPLEGALPCKQGNWDRPPASALRRRGSQRPRAVWDRDPPGATPGSPTNCPIAQMDRVVGLEPTGCRIIPCWGSILEGLAISNLEFYH